jgi:hypothetical protein
MFWKHFFESSKTPKIYMHLCLIQTVYFASVGNPAQSLYETFEKPSMLLRGILKPRSNKIYTYIYIPILFKIGHK